MPIYYFSDTYWLVYNMQLFVYIRGLIYEHVLKTNTEFIKNAAKTENWP